MEPTNPDPEHWYLPCLPCVIERWREITEVDLQIQLEFTVQWFGSHCQSNRCLSVRWRTVLTFSYINCGALWEKNGRGPRFFVVVLFRSNLSFPPTLYRKSDLCIPRNETARPHSQFLHSCICKRFIYSQEPDIYIGFSLVLHCSARCYHITFSSSHLFFPLSV